MIIKEIESKYRKLLGQQALEKLKIYIPMERGLFSQHNKEVNELIEIISKGLNADQHFQPTIEEVKKEWVKLGYSWLECDPMFIRLENKISNSYIVINKFNKTYKCFGNRDYMGNYLTIPEHNLLTKTFKSLEVEDDN